jgi:hypothetical protein
VVVFLCCWEALTLVRRADPGSFRLPRFGLTLLIVGLAALIPRLSGGGRPHEQQYVIGRCRVVEEKSRRDLYLVQTARVTSPSGLGRVLICRSGNRVTGCDAFGWGSARQACPALAEGGNYDVASVSGKPKDCGVCRRRCNSLHDDQNFSTQHEKALRNVIGLV